MLDSLRSVDPGLVKINPYSEKLRMVDVKIQLCAIPRQNVRPSLLKALILKLTRECPVGYDERQRCRRH